MKNDWFASWFDTSYYHTLYKNRDNDEARTFIEKLIQNLEIPKGKRVLDLACGKGRHAITLNNLGYAVLGVDLSLNSIKEANLSAKEKLSFAVHDMREVIPNEHFSAIFNLFTSFGYFDSEKDNLSVLHSVNEMLEKSGLLIIDFMNATHVIKHLSENETKQIDGIEFNISRRFDGKHIFKDICFTDDGEDFHYTERVQALTFEIFEQLLNQTSFKILRTFGDFNLSPFNEQNSERLIIIAEKV